MIVYCVLLTTCFLQAFDKETFFEAKALQHNHEYAKALELYDMIHNPGWGVFYNKGLCYRSQSDHIMALYNFYKADMLEHCNTTIQRAIELTQKDLNISQPFRWTCYFSQQFLKIPALILQILLVVLIAIFIIAEYSQLLNNRLLSKTCVAIICIFGAYVMHYNTVKTRSYCIITADKKMYAINHTGSVVRKMVAKGMRFEILQTMPGWYKIYRSKSRVKLITKSGWITQDDTLLL